MKNSGLSKLTISSMSLSTIFLSFLFLCHWLGKIKPHSITPNTLLKKVIFQLNLSSEFPIHPSLSRSDLPPLSTMHPCTVKPIYWHRVMRRKVKYLLQEPSRSPGKFKKPKLHDDVQGNGLKHRVSERVRGVRSAHGCLLIGWWWGNREPISSSFWVLWPCEHHRLNVFHTVGISISVKQHKEFGSEYCP